MLSCSVIALVTFAVPSEAKRAFNHLSYRKYQHIPLYLEYLPVGHWSEGRHSEEFQLEEERQQRESLKRQREAEDREEQANEMSQTGQTGQTGQTEIGEEADSTTLYIKNLNWKTSEEAVRKMFGKVDGLKTVVLPKKKGPAGESLPMGFGFVVYENRQQALKALNK